jgi:YD repeat-containing protein
MHFDERGLLQFSDDSQTGHKDYAYEQNDPKKIGYLTFVSTSAGPTQYGIDNRGNVTSMLDASNSSSTYTVNSLDQVEQEQRGSAQTGNASTSTTYDAAGNVVQRNVLAGSDANGNPINSITTYTIDELGRMQHRIENGRATSYIYDTAGNLQNVNRPSAPPVTYGYDQRNRMHSMQVGSKPPTTYGYDDDDTRINMTNGRQKLTTFVLNGFGESIGEIDPLGVQTVNRVDAAGRPTDTRTVRTNQDGTVSLWKWSQRQYDPLGRVAQEIRKLFPNPIVLPSDGSDPAGTTDVVTQTVYDDGNHKVTAIDARGLPTVTETDLLGRTLRVTDAAGDKVEYTYFENGNKKSETTTELRPDGGTDTYVITYDYDDQNRLIHVNDTSDPQHVLTTTYAYDPRGLKTSETDAEGHATSYEYDLNGRRTKATLPEGIVTSFSFDDADRLRVITDAKGHTTTYDFDENGRPSRVTWNDSRSATRSYDAEDNLVGTSDPNGTSTILTYDDADRLVRKDFTLGAGVEGPAHEAFTLDPIGRLLSAENGLNTVFFAYDSLDRTLSETLSTSQATFSIAHGFDLAGNPTSLQYPSGRTITLEPDALGHSHILRDGPIPIASLGFAGSRLVSRGRGNNVAETVSYDPNRRITEILQGIAGQPPVEDLTYGWTPTRRKTFAGRQSLGTANAFSYDNALRLTRENIGAALGNPAGTPQASVTYTPDAVDNIAAVADTRTSSTTNVADDRNRVTSLGGVPQTYDPAGNLKTRQASDSFTYDAENRLLRIDHPDGSKEEFSYDAVGRRIGRSITVAGTTSSTTEVEAGYQVVAEYKDGRLDREYVWGNGPDELLQIKRSSAGDGTLDQTLYPLQDTQASITALTDESGAAVERYAYEAYGKTQILAPDNSPRTSSLFGNLYTWQGHPWTGSYGFFRSRLFDSDSRTWLTPDPIQYSSPAANLYTGFNMDGGINGVDPLGAEYSEFGPEYFKSMHLGMWAPGPQPSMFDNLLDELLDQEKGNEPTALPIAAAWKNVYRRHIFINGIHTDQARAMQNGEEVASVFLGEAVTVVHNPTTNSFVDIVQTLFSRAGISTQSTELLVRQIETDLATAQRDWWAGKNGSYVVVHAHSQGGAIAADAVERLTTSERRRAALFTYGGAQGRIDNASELRLYVPYSNVGDRIPDVALFGRVFQMVQGGIHLECGAAGASGLVPIAGPFYFEHRFENYRESLELAREELAKKDAAR